MTKKRFIILVFLTLLIGIFKGLSDNDFYWQSFLGEQIVKYGDFNGIEKVFWGSEGLSTYLDHEWLTNILFYFCTFLGEYYLVWTKLLILICIGLAITYYIYKDDREISTLFAISFIVILFLYCFLILKIKAYTFSSIFMLLEISFLQRYSKERKNKYFIYMFLLCILWNNMHSGSILLFFGVAGIYWLINLREKKSLICGLGCIASLGINPYGYKLIYFDILHNSDSAMKKLITDWKSIDAKEAYGIAIAFVIFIFIGMLLLTNYKEHYFELILGLCILFLAFQSARHILYLYPVILSLGMSIKKNFNINYAYICTCISILSLASIISIFTTDNYQESYCFNYISDELADIILETNKDDNTGYYYYGVTDTCYLLSKGLKQFTMGAFPACRQRVIDSYYASFLMSDNDIEAFIEYYGLTKLLLTHDTLFYYYDVTNVMYNYIANNEDYVNLYEDEYYAYFVRKDLIE